MSSLELNKIAAAVLVAGITAMVVGKVGNMLVAPKPLEKNAYVVEGVGQTQTAAASTDTSSAQIEPIAPLLAAATVADGANVAKRCTACHSFEKGGANKVGPNLWDIIGAKHAHMQGYQYSAALTGMAAKDWTYEEMNQFLANPKAYAPGTKMSFAGIRKPEERAAMIVYLRSLSDAPKPLP